MKPWDSADINLLGRVIPVQLYADSVEDRAPKLVKLGDAPASPASKDKKPTLAKEGPGAGPVRVQRGIRIGKTIEIVISEEELATLDHKGPNSIEIQGECAFSKISARQFDGAVAILHPAAGAEVPFEAFQAALGRRVAYGIHRSGRGRPRLVALRNDLEIKALLLLGLRWPETISHEAWPQPAPREGEAFENLRRAFRARLRDLRDGADLDQLTDPYTEQLAAIVSAAKERYFELHEEQAGAA